MDNKRITPVINRETFETSSEIEKPYLLILIVANRLQTRLQTRLETGLQNKLQNGLFLFKIQLGTPQDIANEQLKH